MKKIRNDIILITSLILIAIIGLILYFTLQKKGNLSVYIYYDKELVEVVDLKKNQELVVNDVVIVIENETVYVKASSCKDKVCMHQGKIHSAGQTITCLPQRVFIQLEGSEVDVGI
ncbi:MAG: NusG domain II-containing protein [Roseburia sp.]|nr:NusG domain II-containing protein [Anaeroplasma bactoclasticum]MCM1197241.1 NusG domain II-containing protein [Roseburia sp.]MCM1556091.1 NusG domain II-containing protein [Anaeroplasma bactoclasticum]